MDNEYGSDYMTIMDEDGTEFELEVLSTLEYNGCTYLAVTPAGVEEGEEVVIEAFMDGTEITCGCYKTKNKKGSPNGLC